MDTDQSGVLTPEAIQSELSRYKMLQEDENQKIKRFKVSTSSWCKKKVLAVLGPVKDRGSHLQVQNLRLHKYIWHLKGNIMLY